MPPKLKRPGETPRAPQRRSVWPLLLVIALGAAAAAVALGISSDGDADAPASAASAPPVESPPGTSELLGGLKPGDAIGSYRVHLLRIIDGQLGVDLLQGEQVLTIWIALKGSRPAVAPRETERYSIYFGFPPQARDGVLREIESILGEIERRLRSTEQSVPVPPGLTSSAPPPSPAP